MKDIKSLLTASALTLALGMASPAIAGEQNAEDGKKTEKHEHKDGEHADHGKHGHKEDGHPHKDGEEHDHEKENAGQSETESKSQ